MSYPIHRLCNLQIAQIPWFHRTYVVLFNYTCKYCSHCAILPNTVQNMVSLNYTLYTCTSPKFSIIIMLYSLWRPQTDRVGHQIHPLPHPHIYFPSWAASPTSLHRRSFEERSTSNIASTIGTEMLTTSHETGPYTNAQIAATYAANADLLAHNDSQDSIHMFGSDNGDETGGVVDFSGQEVYRMAKQGDCILYIIL